MKSTLFGILLLALSMTVTACGPSANNETPAKPAETAPAATPPAASADGSKWTATEGIDAPESVYVDAATGDIYSSQIGGMPDKRDGNGHIAKLSADGKVISASWATG